MTKCGRVLSLRGFVRYRTSPRIERGLTRLNDLRTARSASCFKLRNFADQITLGCCADNPPSANSYLFSLAYLNPRDFGFLGSRRAGRARF
jgi:hypothetical protein